jgi:hypothetical protein
MQWAIWLVYHQKIMKSSPPQVEITFFTLFYTYIVLHLHCFTQHKINLHNFIVTFIGFMFYIYTYTNTDEH